MLNFIEIAIKLITYKYNLFR